MIDWAIGLSTGCFHDVPIGDCLEPIQQSGFSRIEISSSPRHCDFHDPGVVQGTAERIEELGLEPYSFHAPFAEHIDITSFDETSRAQALAEIYTAATAASVLGVKYLVIHPGPEKGGQPDEERIARLGRAASMLSRVASRCRELGVGLVLENMLPHLFAGHVRDLLWILGSLRGPEIGVCLDTGHAYLSGDLRDVAHKLSGHLWMVHASDTHGTHDDHLPPGDGLIAWEPLLRQLARSNFRGTLMLELAPAGDAGTTLAAARRGRRHLWEIERRLRSPAG